MNSFVAPRHPPFTLADLLGKDYVAKLHPNADGEVLVDEDLKSTLIGTEIKFPLTIGIPGEEPYEFPVEAMVSIVGGQKIIRRYPNKSKIGGSIKERWTQDDYKIKIKGTLMDFSGEFAESDLLKLRNVCLHQGNIIVDHLIFKIFGIERIVIKNYSIPHTIGEALQRYELKCYSDFLFDTLLTENA